MSTYSFTAGQLLWLSGAVVAGVVAGNTSTALARTPAAAIPPPPAADQPRVAALIATALETHQWAFPTENRRVWARALELRPELAFMATDPAAPRQGGVLGYMSSLNPGLTAEGGSGPAIWETHGRTMADLAAPFASLSQTAWEGLVASGGASGCEIVARAFIQGRKLTAAEAAASVRPAPPCSNEPPGQRFGVREPSSGGFSSLFRSVFSAVVPGGLTAAFSAVGLPPTLAGPLSEAVLSRV